MGQLREREKHHKVSLSELRLHDVLQDEQISIDCRVGATLLRGRNAISNAAQHGADVRFRQHLALTLPS